METLPVLRDADAKRNMYRGIAMSQMRILKAYMLVARLQECVRKVTLDDGTIIVCTASYGKEDIYVYTLKVPVIQVDQVVKPVEITGIIMHPRSGSIDQLHYTEYESGPYGSMPVSKHIAGVTGGWKRGKELLTTEYPYPLDDNDIASFYVKDLTTGVFTDPGQYGNLYWDNGAVYDTETKKWSKPYKALSWKGTPTRHFRLPSNIDIPGFSTFETATEGEWEDIPQYTAFSTRLYQGGVVLAEAPRYSWPYSGETGGRCLIMGAMQDEDGVIYIVCQSDHYGAPEPLQKPGFFLTLWCNKRVDGRTLVDGWYLITEFAYSRNGLPWFGDAEGAEFVCSNGDKLTAEGEFTNRSGGVGTWQEIAEFVSEVTGYNPVFPIGTKFHRAMDMSFNAGFSAQDFCEPEAASDVRLTFSAISAVQHVPSVYHEYSGTFPHILDDPGTPVIFGPKDWYGNGSAYTVTGGQAPYTWNYPTGCGMGTITVTDCKGKTATFTVRMPVGIWTTPVASYFYNSYTTYRHEEISEDTKTIWYGEASRNSQSVVEKFYVKDVNNVCVESGTTIGGYTTIPGRLDYTFDAPVALYPTAATACYTPSGGVFYAYRRLSSIYTQKWVCP